MAGNLRHVMDQSFILMERDSQDLPTARSGVPTVFRPPFSMFGPEPSRSGAYNEEQEHEPPQAIEASWLCKGHCVPSQAIVSDLAHGFYSSISPWYTREHRYGLDNLANRK